MAEYTYRIETEPEIIVWIDCDGYQFLRQPHHPQAYMNAPWSNAQEAEQWAVERVAQFVAEEQRVVEYEANKKSASEKLMALGLTAEEIAALGK